MVFQMEESSLITILQSGTETKDNFFEYLNLSGNEENSNFFKDIEKFRTIPSSNERYRKAKKIFKKYVKENGSNSLNINLEMRERVASLFQDSKLSSDYCPTTIFDTVVSEVIVTLSFDTFQRFKVYLLGF